MAKIRNHARSEHHKEANDSEVLFILPKQIKDIAEHLDIVGHVSQKPGNRKVFLTILENTKFLARQGLPLRGDGNENNSNFKQLFCCDLKVRYSRSGLVDEMIPTYQKIFKMRSLG